MSHNAGLISIKNSLKEENREQAVHAGQEFLPKISVQWYLLYQ